MKKVGTVLLLAVAHLGLTQALVKLVLSIMGTHGYQSPLPLFVQLMMTITKVLYFPIIALTLYPRNWFPGNLIFIPMFANSLLWAAVIYICYRAVLRWSGRP